MINTDEIIVSKQSLKRQTIFKDVLWLMEDSALQCLIKCDEEESVVKILRGSTFALSLLGKNNYWKITGKKYMSILLIKSYMV